MFGDIHRARILAHSSVFIGLISLGSWISIPFFPVPLTLQTLFIILAGCIMRRSAFIPVTLYLLLGAAGLPLFHNGIAGIGILLGPTGGYLIGFIPAAFITGLAYETEPRIIRIAGLVAATGLIYVFGVGWLVISTGMGILQAILIGVVPFIPGDLIKGYAAYRIAEQLT